jgi:hypothetical protein
MNTAEIVIGKYQCVTEWVNEMGYRWKPNKDDVVVLAYDTVNDTCVCKIPGQKQRFEILGSHIRQHFKWYVMEVSETKNGIKAAPDYVPGEVIKSYVIPEQPATTEVDGMQQVVIEFPDDATQPKAATVNSNDALYGYIATNKSDRQRFKRKLERTRQWLTELPKNEQDAMFKMLTEAIKMKEFVQKCCDHACSPSDYYKGGKCDKMGCYRE